MFICRSDEWIQAPCGSLLNFKTVCMAATVYYHKFWPTTGLSCRGLQHVHYVNIEHMLYYFWSPSCINQKRIIFSPGEWTSASCYFIKFQNRVHGSHSVLAILACRFTQGASACSLCKHWTHAVLFPKYNMYQSERVYFQQEWWVNINSFVGLINFKLVWQPQCTSKSGLQVHQGGGFLTHTM